MFETMFSFSVGVNSILKIAQLPTLILETGQNSEKQIEVIISPEIIFVSILLHVFFFVCVLLGSL